ncbi:MAG: hypothetical protein PSV35_01125, partial [bacterium]|nr:hypothetical protein [bacterium]
MGYLFNGRSIDITHLVTWNSSALHIVTINDTDLEEAVVVGNAVISASLNGVTINLSPFNVSAVMPTLVSISVTPSAAILCLE